MCGIAGIVRMDRSPIGDEEVYRLSIASAFMRHRGPDDDGLLISESGIASFAHRRLSIIDPTSEGHQPMVSASGNILVFNGEIYNYRELASAYHLMVPPSDTAVLLALLELRGTSILPELRGFFTFAWWNESERKLIIVRDPFGKKPLYYGEFQRRFVFASELRALLSSGLVPFELSSDGLRKYLRYYCLPHPQTMVEGVYSLEPGSILCLQNGKIEIARWYHLPAYQGLRISYDEAVRETRRILERSVHDRLVSDVPVGSFLSGGLDSNAITALAARQHSTPMETFSIGFISQHVESEAKWASIGANTYGTIHHECNFTSTRVAELLPEFFQSMDSPTGDGLNTFLVAKAARESCPTIKVVLSGVGGDEAFLGYHKYRVLARQDLMMRSAALLPRKIRSWISENLIGGHHSRLRAAVRTILSPEKSRTLFSISEIEHLTGDRFDGSTEGYTEDTFILSLLRSDIEHYLPDMLLRDLDAMTMAQRLEARAPLLDRELMEFTWQLPLSHKLHGSTKQLLADSVKDILPKALLNKPKTGFELPMGEWLRTVEFYPYFDGLLSNDFKLVRDGFLSQTSIQRVHDEFKQNHSHYLKPWSLISLEYWYRHCKAISKQATMLQPYEEIQ